MDPIQSCIVCEGDSPEAQLTEYELCVCDSCYIELFLEDFLCLEEPELDPDQEEVMLQALEEIWWDELPRYSEPDWYELYGVPSDIPEWQQEAFLEAAVGSS